MRSSWASVLFTGHSVTRESGHSAHPRLQETTNAAIVIDYKEKTQGCGLNKWIMAANEEKRMKRPEQTVLIIDSLARKEEKGDAQNREEKRHRKKRRSDRRVNDDEGSQVVKECHEQ